MRKIFLGLLLVFVVALILVVGLAPSEFRISRSVLVNAPPSAVFPHVNELRRWERWSPYEKLDPAMKKSYSGPEAGIGASSSWAGNAQVGEGRTTITRLVPGELIELRLEMFKPMAADHLVEFGFKSEGTGTVVSWTMRGRSGVFGKIIHLFFSMERMVGPQFDQGLAQLKNLVEAEKK